MSTVSDGSCDASSWQAAFLSILRLAGRGRLHAAYPGTLATFAVNFVNNGRHVGGRQDVARDVMSPVAQERRGFRTSSIDLYDTESDEWRQVAIADRKDPVPDTAAFRIDFARWLRTLTRRDRRVIAAFISGEGTFVVASRFGTRWAMNATGLDMWRTDPFPLADVRRVPFGDSDALRRCFEGASAPPAAFIAEPIEGNGGIIVPPPEYWPEVRMLCDRFGVLLVLDEVQTGMNRTGRWFACEHWGVVPDILVTSKALGNGFPISAFITTPTIADSYRRPGASTYGGNPVSAVAALATLEFHRSHQLGQRAQSLGEHLRSELTATLADFPYLRRPHGIGLMIGLFVQDHAGNADPARCDLLLEALKDNGVLAGKTGPGRSTLTFMPPLTVSELQIADFVVALRRSAEAVQQQCS